MTAVRKVDKVVLLMFEFLRYGTCTCILQSTEIVGVLQAQMQALQAEKENADKRVEEIRALMGKGKWVDRPVTSGRSERMRLLCLHAPYTEYVQFIVHLRTIRPSTATPPPITTLLPLPFLARLVVEDS